MIDPTTITRLLAAADVRFVRVEVPDLHGISRSKLLPLAAFPKVLTDGTAFYGGLLHTDARGDDVPPDAYPGEPPFLPDYLVRPDLDTLAVLDSAQAPRMARVVGDLYNVNDTPVEFAPRTVVKGLVAEYAALGVQPRFGFEYEFFLLRDLPERPPVFADRQLAATQRNLFDPAFTEALFAAAAALGIAPLSFFVENAPGQIELTFAASDGLTAPDRAFAFKGLVKEVAIRHGYLASFMTKRFIDEASSGGHIHLSLVSQATGLNLFTPSTPANPGDLSTIGRHVLAGQLAHAPALAALLSPTVNCYKRYRPHIFAPNNVSWGVDHRQAAVRVPVAGGQAARLENRIGGAAADPYIAAAAVLAAGLDGIHRELEPPPASVGDMTTDPALPPLPADLDQALAALAADQPLRMLLGYPFVDLFLLVKRSEVIRCGEAVPDYGQPSFRQRIDPWEFAEYGELI